MKHIVLVIFIFSINLIFSQKIEKKISSVKVEKDYFYRNDKRGLEEIYFDDQGNILEKLRFGSQHRRKKLNQIIAIYQYLYNEGKLTLSKDYLLLGQEKEYREYYTKYKYDNEDMLLNETSYTAENDSLFMTINYINKQNVSETHFSESTYLQRKYDSQKNLIEFNQIFENSDKIRWQNKYEYSDNCRTEDHQTYYEDGNNTSTKSITCYDSKKRIISHESKTYFERSEFFYASNGIVSKIIRTRLDNNKYVDVEVVKFISHNTNILSDEAINLINKNLLEDEY